MYAAPVQRLTHRTAMAARTPILPGRGTGCEPADQSGCPTAILRQSGAFQPDRVPISPVRDTRPPSEGARTPLSGDAGAPFSVPAGLRVPGPAGPRLVRAAGPHRSSTAKDAP
ncbi:hypothetical protein GCM10023336_48700 [Streptomyces similanensis]|uniref:Uncharacterized protein n=1 Tax=Streptomyces similanensis TaxID=1274988 RepID=A0ABP9KXV0_9ACTN